VTTILVGVEGSADSTRALRWAVDEARRRGARLRIVHAYQRAGSPALCAQLDRQARTVLDAAVDEATQRAPELTVLPELACDEPAARALLARAADADVLVVGSRGLGGFTGLLVGSVSDQCVRHAPCSVAVIRAQPAAV
jgi:nucleotide-binding universal stress UspA family protein